MISISCWWVCEPEKPLWRGILKEPGREEQLPSKMKCVLRDARGCVSWETCTRTGVNAWGGHRGHWRRVALSREF